MGRRSRSNGANPQLIMLPQEEDDGSNAGLIVFVCSVLLLMICSVGLGGAGLLFYAPLPSVTRERLSGVLGPDEALVSSNKKFALMVDRRSQRLVRREAAAFLPNIFGTLVEYPSGPVERVRVASSGLALVSPTGEELILSVEGLSAVEMTDDGDLWFLSSEGELLCTNPAKELAPRHHDGASLVQGCRLPAALQVVLGSNQPPEESEAEGEGVIVVPEVTPPVEDEELPTQEEAEDDTPFCLKDSSTLMQNASEYYVSPSFWAGRFYFDPSTAKIAHVNDFQCDIKFDFEPCSVDVPQCTEDHTGSGGTDYRRFNFNPTTLEAIGVFDYQSGVLAKGL